MADKKLEPVEVLKGDAIEVAVYDGAEYLLGYEQTSGTITDYYHSSAPSTALGSAPYILSTVVKRKSSFYICPEEYISTNGAIKMFHKIYRDVYEDYGSGLVGPHPKGRRP